MDVIGVHVEYATYHCTMDGGDYFPGECEYPEDDGCPMYCDRLQDKMIIYCICIYAKHKDHIIHKSVKTLEYDEGEGIRIGRQYIPWDRIEYLTINGEIKVDKQ